RCASANRSDPVTPMSNTKFDANRESEAEVHLDFAGITSEDEVHELFASALHFPHFYGRNWDAFWDVLTGYGCFPSRLVLFSTEHLRTVVPRAYEQLQTCFADCQRNHPDMAPSVTWR
ncbi:MAG: barstar family protein, partial [Chthoniobacter sp.]|uniref:barstar family protein n=1 Tax=Chthoniobacter sp. TaxID=2510640 RepID=UPI0032A5C895